MNLRKNMRIAGVAGELQVRAEFLVDKNEFKGPAHVTERWLPVSLDFGFDRVTREPVLRLDIRETTEHLDHLRAKGWLV